MSEERDLYQKLFGYSKKSDDLIYGTAGFIMIGFVIWRIFIYG